MQQVRLHVLLQRRAGLHGREHPHGNVQPSRLCHVPDRLRAALDGLCVGQEVGDEHIAVPLRLRAALVVVVVVVVVLMVVRVVLLLVFLRLIVLLRVVLLA